MEAELRQAVREAAGRAEVSRAVAAVYATLGEAIELRRPICKSSGRCCRFEEFGHRLYVTTMELAKFTADLAAVSTDVSPSPGSTLPGHTPHALPIFSSVHSATSASDKTGCRFQLEGLCGVHDIRPFGCRIFFCDETSTQWQHDMYEKLHGELRALHDRLNVPYYYVEWRFALQVCL